MNSKAHDCGGIFRQLTGWAALLLYVGAFSPVGAGVVSLAGSLDPNHHALIQTDARGTRVVLHHEQTCAPHHHGLVARTLTLFAAPVNGGDPDHVLKFGGPDSFSRPVHFAAPATANFALPEFALSETGLWSALESCVFAIATHPPPDGRGQLFYVRSTVLLI